MTEFRLMHKKEFDNFTHFLTFSNDGRAMFPLKRIQIELVSA